MIIKISNHNNNNIIIINNNNNDKIKIPIIKINIDNKNK